MPSWRVGTSEVTPLLDGTLADQVDSVVGKASPTWSGYSRADTDDSIIRLPIYAYLIRSGAELILVDTGWGDRPDPEDDVIRPPGPVVAALAAIGVFPNEVTTIVNTHLHSDHVGGNTTASGGTRILTFPNARVCIQRSEWRYRRDPAAKHRALYREDLWEPLAATGALELLDGEVPLTSSVSCIPAPGHTPGHQIVLIDDGRASVVLLGDAATVVGQFMEPSWTSPYDLDPSTATATKQAIQDRIGEAHALIAFGHDEPCDWPLELPRSRRLGVAGR